MSRGRPETSVKPGLRRRGRDDRRYTRSTKWLARVMAVPRLREVGLSRASRAVVPPGPADGPERRARSSRRTPVGCRPSKSAVKASSWCSTGERSDVGRPTAKLWRVRKPIDERYRARFAADQEGARPRNHASDGLAAHDRPPPDHPVVARMWVPGGRPSGTDLRRARDGRHPHLHGYDGLGGKSRRCRRAVRHARSSRAVAEMADRAAWCSSDPLCSESTAAGVDSLNLAACHACMLLPEVSCEEMNVLLDRAAVVDTPAHRASAFSTAVRLMARMCPAVVSEHTKSPAEVDVFGIVARELSEEWTALHSLGIAVHPRKPWAEADFVLVGPPGVFVLEVKGQHVRRENGKWIFTSGGGRDSEPKAEGPFDQAGGASAALFKYLSVEMLRRSAHRSSASASSRPTSASPLRDPTSSRRWSTTRTMWRLVHALRRSPRGLLAGSPHRLKGAVSEPLDGRTRRRDRGHPSRRLRRPALAPVPRRSRQ